MHHEAVYCTSTPSVHGIPNNLLALLAIRPYEGGSNDPSMLTRSNITSDPPGRLFEVFAGALDPNPIGAADHMELNSYHATSSEMRNDKTRLRCIAPPLDTCHFEMVMALTPPCQEFCGFFLITIVDAIF